MGDRDQKDSGSAGLFGKLFSAVLGEDAAPDPRMKAALIRKALQRKAAAGGVPHAVGQSQPAAQKAERSAEATAADEVTLFDGADAGGKTGAMASGSQEMGSGTREMSSASFEMSSGSRESDGLSSKLLSLFDAPDEELAAQDEDQMKTLFDLPETVWAEMAKELGSGSRSAEMSSAAMMSSASFEMSSSSGSGA